MSHLKSNFHPDEWHVLLLQDTKLDAGITTLSWGIIYNEVGVLLTNGNGKS